MNNRPAIYTCKHPSIMCMLVHNVHVRLLFISHYILMSNVSLFTLYFAQTVIVTLVYMFWHSLIHTLMHKYVCTVWTDRLTSTCSVWLANVAWLTATQETLGSCPIRVQVARLTVVRTRWNGQHHLRWIHCDYNTTNTAKHSYVVNTLKTQHPKQYVNIML